MNIVAEFFGRGARRRPSMGPESTAALPFLPFWRLRPSPFPAAICAGLRPVLFQFLYLFLQAVNQSKQIGGFMRFGGRGRLLRARTAGGAVEC